MHPQLSSIVEEFESALERVRELARRFDEGEWTRRPSADAWSAAECIAHLNITSEAYLRVLPAAVAEARTLTGAAPARYRLDLMGWLVSQTAGRRRRFSVRTPPPFEPVAAPPRPVLLAEFERLQREQIDIARSVDGLPIQRVRVVSPFADRVRYSLYSALWLIPEHQHRHLDQAEAALTASSGVDRSGYSSG